MPDESRKVELSVGTFYVHAPSMRGWHSILSVLERQDADELRGVLPLLQQVAARPAGSDPAEAFTGDALYGIVQTCAKLAKFSAAVMGACLWQPRVGDERLHPSPAGATDDATMADLALVLERGFAVGLWGEVLSAAKNLYPLALRLMAADAAPAVDQRS